MLEMHLPHNPMEDRLARPIRRHRIRTHVHAADTAHGAPDADELRALFALLHEGKGGLEEVEGPEAIDSDVLLHDLRVAGGEGGEVVADAGVGDDEVEAGDALRFDDGYGGAGVGVGSAVDLDDDELAGGVFVEGGELPRGGVLGVSDAGDDGGGGAGEVDFDEAQANA